MTRIQKRPFQRSMALSVVVPCYNEQDGIAELYRRVTAACRQVAGTSYEVVLVIDGATDGTREAIFELARQDGHVAAIDLARNYGHQIALSSGLEFCRGDRILVLDADLQYPPELLGAMTAVDEPYWFGTQPVVEQRITGLRLIWPDDNSLAEMARDITTSVPQDVLFAHAAGGAGTPLAATVYGRQARRYAHLAVIDGGRN